jgi:hypothetical protein
MFLEAEDAIMCDQPLEVSLAAVLGGRRTIDIDLGIQPVQGIQDLVQDAWRAASHVLFFRNFQFQCIVFPAFQYLDLLVTGE